MTGRGHKYGNVWEELSVILIVELSCGDPELEMGRGLKLACVDGTAALRGLFLSFPGVYTSGMGFQKILDMV